MSVLVLKTMFLLTRNWIFFYGTKFVFSEYEKTGDLNKKSTRVVADKLKEFIESKFENATRQQIESVCKAALIVFPCLEHKPSSIEGIVSLSLSSSLQLWLCFVILLLNRMHCMITNEERDCFTTSWYTKSIAKALKIKTALIMIVLTKSMKNRIDVQPRTGTPTVLQNVCG